MAWAWARIDWLESVDVRAWDLDLLPDELANRVSERGSQADLDRNKVALADAQQKYTRAQELTAKQLLAQSDFDAAKIALDSAKAVAGKRKLAMSSAVSRRTMDQSRRSMALAGAKDNV